MAFVSELVTSCGSNYSNKKSLHEFLGAVTSVVNQVFVGNFVFFFEKPTDPSWIFLNLCAAPTWDVLGLLVNPAELSRQFLLKRFSWFKWRFWNVKGSQTAHHDFSSICDIMPSSTTFQLPMPQLQPRWLSWKIFSKFSECLQSGIFSSSKSAMKQLNFCIFPQKYRSLPSKSAFYLEMHQVGWWLVKFFEQVFQASFMSRILLSEDRQPLRALGRP